MRRTTFFLTFAVATLLLAGVVSYFASGSPDGLERVSRDKGFAKTGEEHALADGPMADYSTRGVDSSPVAGGVAGAAGVVVTLVLASGVAFAVRRRRAGPHGG